MLTRFLTQKELAALLALAVSLCVGGFALHHHGRDGVSVPVADADQSAPFEAAPSADVPLPPPESSDWAGAVFTVSEATVTVAVMGAVNVPGVYTLWEDARVDDALTAARGATEEAVLDDINLAAPLIDGTTLRIPRGAVAETEGGVLVMRRGESAAAINPSQYTRSGWDGPRLRGQASVTGTQVAGTPVELNRATSEQLQSLPGIGPRTAEAIIRYRSHTPFLRVEDLENVRGIGPKKLADLMPLVTVTPLN